MVTTSEAAGLVAVTVCMSLVAAMARKGLLEQALLNLESQQAAEPDPQQQAVYAAARDVLEHRIRHLAG